MKEIFERVSVRNFTDQEVEAEKVELLLRAAMAAPSAGNQQPWTFCVIRDPALLERLSGASPYAGPMRRAKVGIAVMGLGQGLRFPEYWEQDLGACTQNLLLEAEHLGLGAVWMGIAPLEERMRAVRGILGLGEDVKPFCLVAVGYPAKRPAHNDRYDPSRVRML